MTHFLKYLGFLCFITVIIPCSLVFADTNTLIEDFSFGSFGQYGDGQFLLPISITLGNDETIYVSDYIRGDVQAFTTNGTFIRKWNGEGTPAGTFTQPWGIATSPKGDIYTTINRKNQTVQFTSSGVFVRFFEGDGSQPGAFNRPRGIAINSTGYVFVADYGNNRVEIFTGNGEYYDSWNTATGMPSDFLAPTSIDIGKDDSVYIGLESLKIYHFSPDKALLHSWQLPYRDNFSNDICVDPLGYLNAVVYGNKNYSAEPSIVYQCATDGSVNTLQTGGNEVFLAITVDEKGGYFCTHEYGTRYILGTKTPALPVPRLGWSYPLTDNAETDIGHSIFHTSDGGSIETGEIFIGTKSDILVIKRDENGIIQWKRSYGGSSTDKGTSIIETNEGNFLLTGYTNSNDGDVSGNHGNYDVWVVKTDPEGEILWQKCYGGSDSDYGMDILGTADGNYILTGDTYSNNWDVSGNHGLADLWVVKIEPDGTIIWQRCYGGTDGDIGRSIQETDNGEFILTGDTYSNNGDVSGNHGGSDIWGLKINQEGGVIWQRCYGGTDKDTGSSIMVTGNGGYLLTGGSESHNGDIKGNHGNADMVGIAIDTDGEILWQKCYGGTLNDYGLDVTAYNERYIFIGRTGSVNRDITSSTGYHGKIDAWVIQTDAQGAIVWNRCFGGSASDTAYSGVSRGDGTYVMTGETYSHDGDISDPAVSDDLWTFMIDEMDSDFLASPGSGPAPLTVTFTGWTSSAMKADSWNWYFGDGGISHEQNPVHQYTAPGIYTVRMEVAGSGFTESVEKPGYIAVT